MVWRTSNIKNSNLLIIININYINSIILEMMKTPEDYYNSKSKQESGVIAGYCFVGAVLIILAVCIAEIIKLY